MLKFRCSQFNLCKRFIRSFIAILCSLVLLPGEAMLAATPQDSQPTQEAAAKLPPEQLDSLVAPIALYPDPLLSQTLVASTYPLEVIQLQQWLAKNKGLKDKALADAVKKENWDPSIQATAALPDVVKQLAENIKWTTDLGNAFLAQQNDVMDAVQRMRAKAQGNGSLKSGEQQKVETKVVESKQVIVIEQSNPEVVYVPSYNPTVVYGAPVYPYPPIAYPPPGYYAAGMAISFGVGMAMGAAWGGGWGYNNNWGGGNNNITINNNNSFVNNSNRQNVQGGNRAQAKGGNSTWQHNPQHRGGAPYGDRGTANKYGGSARGDSLQSRQSQARQQGGAGNRGGASAGNMDRGGNRGNSPSAGNMDRGGTRNASTKDRGGASAGTMDRGGNRGSSGGGDRGGSSASRGGSGAFGGGSGSSARASSSRGSSSFGGGGGGGRSGGGRSGGGGRRR